MTMIGKEFLKQVISEQRASFLKKETGIKREVLERIRGLNFTSPAPMQDYYRKR